MEKWYVAPSYQSWNLIKVDETNHKAIVRQKCWKCGGSGQYYHFGFCYQCDGSGIKQKEVKAYTAEEYVKYLAAQDKTKARKAEKEAARKQDLIDNSETNKKARLVEWGYDPENPVIYLVGGGSTFEIKDWLKENGCKFCKELGWYSNNIFDVPDGYKFATIDFLDVYEWMPLTQRFEIKENAKQIADAALATLLPPSKSEYIGEIKERLRNINAILTSTRFMNGYYGTSIIYTFKNDENILTWITTSEQDIEIGDHCLLTGTVKDHKEYNGEKVTYLNRCIIKKGE